MKKLNEVLGHEAEISALVKEAKAQGVDEEFLNKVLAASETPEDTIADLRVLAEPRGKRITPKTAKPPPYERELDPHEESIFLETLAGEHEPETVV
jgi:hypothetical protein